jgi:hypothetical protein
MRSCPQFRGMGFGLSWRPARCERKRSFADKGVPKFQLGNEGKKIAQRFSAGNSVLSIK